MDSALIEIVRPRGLWRDFLRSYLITIDGATVGRIRAGRNLKTRVAPGSHVAQARIDWTGSQPFEFDVEANSTMRLRVEPAGSVVDTLGRAVSRDAYLRLSIVKSDGLKS